MVKFIRALKRETERDVTFMFEPKIKNKQTDLLMKAILTLKDLFVWAKAFEKEVPTSKEPKSPGPRVKAMADNCFFSIFAVFKAVSMTGMIFCWWARDASSGTTPPYCS